MAYIGNGPGVTSQRIISEFEPTTSTTSFTPSSGYTVGYVDVYLNGIKLQNGTDFTASNGTNVVLTDAAVSGDLVEIIAYIPRGLSDGYTKSEAETKFLDASSNLSDLGNASTARTNLGLGTAATTASTAYATAAQGAKADSAVQNLSDLSITATAAEINYVDGVTSNVQTQLNAKQATLTSGDITTSLLADGAVTAVKIAAGAAVPTQSGHSGKFLTTDGTNASWATVTIPDEIIVSATQPTGISQGQVWYDTTLDLLKAYDGTNWNKVSPVIPSIISVSGFIYSGAASTLTITGTGFLTGSCDVNFSATGISTQTVNVTASSDTSLTVSVPSGVYGLSAGTSVSITVSNADNGTSPSYSLTVAALPTGGTITTSGGYRIHKFTSSSSFTTSSALSAEILIVAGGGGGGTGGGEGGGGGAGGLIYYGAETPKTPTGSAVSISSGTYSVTVGGGGTGATDYNNRNNTNGGNSAVASLSLTTAIGGGSGGCYPGANTGAGASGGSGGGGGGNTSNGGNSSGGSGTTGQGFAGGTGGYNVGGQFRGGGGGGASQVGESPLSVYGSTFRAGDGGDGLAYSITGSSVTYAGGGGGHTNGGTNANGGAGGGGNDGSSGAANTGGGGGASSGNGGSGVVIIRYQL